LLLSPIQTIVTAFRLALAQFQRKTQFPGEQLQIPPHDQIACSAWFAFFGSAALFVYGEANPSQNSRRHGQLVGSGLCRKVVSKKNGCGRAARLVRELIKLAPPPVYRDLERTKLQNERTVMKRIAIILLQLLVTAAGIWYVFHDT
jgi:hypothetical protein